MTDRTTSLAFLCVFVVIITAFACCVQATQKPEKGVEVTLTIKFGETANNVTEWTPGTAFAPPKANDKWLIKNITIENATVYGALSSASNKCNFTFESYYDGNYGSSFVTSIGGMSGGTQSAWQYWVNGDYGQVGSSLAKVKKGDKIEWRLVKYG